MPNNDDQIKTNSNEHSVVNLSLDIGTRQMVLTIDGIITPFTEVSIHKFIDFEGDEVLRFAYTVETTNPNGMTERREFFLPSPEDISRDSISVNEHGFSSKILNDDEKAKRDIIEYMSKD